MEEHLDLVFDKEAYKPFIGKVFDTEEEAYNFYNTYGGTIGFSIRRDYLTISRTDEKILGRKFVCNKQGVRGKDKRRENIKNPRAKTRTNCEAFMLISFDRQMNKFVVVKWNSVHNHSLHIKECMHMMRSQRKITAHQGINVKMAVDCGISLKSTYELMSTQAGGRELLGFTRKDQENYLRTTRERDLIYGDAGSLLRYFQNETAKNPLFYHGIQLDSTEQVTNIFWADPKMIIDYGYFGDLVGFYDNEYNYVVSYDHGKDFVSCACKKIERIGILCSHAIKILDVMNIKKLSDSYILKRWRLDARTSFIHIGDEHNITARKATSDVLNADDLSLLASSRYRELCPKMIHIAQRGSENDAAYQLVSRIVKELTLELDKLEMSYHSIVFNDKEKIDVTSDVEIKRSTSDIPGIRVASLKKKDGYKAWGRRRLKPWHEKIKTPNKTTKTKTQLTRISKIKHDERDPYVPHSSTTPSEITVEFDNSTNYLDSRLHSSRPFGTSQPTISCTASIKYITQFSENMRSYIESVKDVIPDGNCGFRAIADLLSTTDMIISWERVRQDLMDELETYWDLYMCVFGSIDRVNEIKHALLWTEKIPAPIDKWMTIPDMGHLIASRYNVVLHSLSPSQNLTFLPLRTEPVTFHLRKHIAIGFVDNVHFVEVFFKAGYPFPQIHLSWFYYRLKCAEGWDVGYIDKTQTISTVNARCDDQIIEISD